MEVETKNLLGINCLPVSMVVELESFFKNKIGSCIRNFLNWHLTLSVEKLERLAVNLAVFLYAVLNEEGRELWNSKYD